jgi:hypothetical protein
LQGAFLRGGLGIEERALFKAFSMGFSEGFSMGFSRGFPKVFLGIFRVFSGRFQALSRGVSMGAFKARISAGKPRRRRGV